MRHRVRRAEVDGDGERRGDQHVAAGVVVLRMVDRALEVGLDEAQRVQRSRLLVRARVHGHVALDRVGHGVHARGRGDLRRQRARGLGVEDRQPREQRQIPQLELDAGVVILHDRGDRDLRARSGCRRHARERGDVERRPHAVVGARERVQALVVVDCAPMREQRVGDLRGVHDRSAAHGEERVGAGGPSLLRAACDRRRGRVLRHVVKHPGDLQSAVLDAGRDPVHEPGAADHLVGDHEDALRALLHELEADAVEEVAARDDARAAGVLGEVLEARRAAGGRRPGWRLH